MSDESPPRITHGGDGHRGEKMSPSKKLFVWFLLGCLGMGLVMSVLYVVLQSAVTVHAIRDTQKTNLQTNLNSAKVLKLIQSCVTPKGKCAERGAKSQAGFAGQLNQYVVLSASCTAKLTLDGLPPGIDQDELTRMITSCVLSQLDHIKKAIKDQQ